MEEKPLDTAEKADPDKHKEDNEGSFPLYVLRKVAKQWSIPDHDTN